MQLATCVGRLGTAPFTVSDIVMSTPNLSSLRKHVICLGPFIALTMEKGKERHIVACRLPTRLSVQSLKSVTDLSQGLHSAASESGFGNERRDTPILASYHNLKSQSFSTRTLWNLTTPLGRCARCTMPRTPHWTRVCATLLLPRSPCYTKCAIPCSLVHNAVHRK